MTKDLQVKIDADTHGEYLFVDMFDDERVWLSANVRGGGARVTLLRHQAEMLIKALQDVLAAQEAKKQ